MLLAASLFTVDVSLPLLPFAPLLLWLHGGFRLDRRRLAVLAGWGLVMLPYLWLLLRFVRNPAGYAGRAIVVQSASQRIGNGLRLWADNFRPWRWPLPDTI